MHEVQAGEAKRGLSPQSRAGSRTILVPYHGLFLTLAKD